MASKRLVWFVLVDGDGNPYKGTTASSVNIPSSYVIDQFRDAVKEKCDRQGDDLKGILSSKLHVYANKEAFDGKVDSLEEDSTIGTFGSSKKEALVVVVPSRGESSIGGYHQGK